MEYHEGNNLRGVFFWGEDLWGRIWYYSLEMKGKFWYKVPCCCFLVDGCCYFLVFYVAHSHCM